jgi:hypothetical protein
MTLRIRREIDVDFEAIGSRLIEDISAFDVRHETRPILLGAAISDGRIQ